MLAGTTGEKKLKEGTASGPTWPPVVVASGGLNGPSLVFSSPLGLLSEQRPICGDIEHLKVKKGEYIFVEHLLSEKMSE